MRKRTYVWVMFGLFALVSWPVLAQPGQEPNSIAVLDAAHEEDAAFDRYVNMDALREALSSMNSTAFVDGLLQLAEGERVLLRAHRSGANLKQLLPLAIKLAADQRDKESLGRLSAAASRAGFKEVEDQIAFAMKLAAAPRSASKPIPIAIDDFDEASIFTYKFLQDEIKKGALMGGKKSLKELADSLTDWPDLAPALLAHLKSQATAALASAVDHDPATVELMSKVLGGTRAGTLAISTDYGQGSVDTLPNPSTPKHPTPVAKCNIKNTTANTVTFQMIGTGKNYTLTKNQSMNFTVYGKVTVLPAPPTQDELKTYPPGTLNISMTPQASGPTVSTRFPTIHFVGGTKKRTITFQVFNRSSSFSFTAPNQVTLTNGNFNITGSSADTYALKRR